MTADAETRAEVLAEIRGVLAALKEQAGIPLIRFGAPAADGLQAVPSVPWDTSPTATPEKDILEALQAYRAGATLTLPGGLTVQHVGPTPAVLGLLHRLTHLLGLSPLEQEFFTACASDQLLDAFDGRLAYADWLEERGDEAAGLRVRKLTPQPGDVLVHHAPPTVRTQDDLEKHVGSARALADRVAARGVNTVFIVLPPGGSVELMSEGRMAAAGWVPAARVAEEREACAELAENSWSDTPPEEIAAAIRARGGADPA